MPQTQRAYRTQLSADQVHLFPYHFIEGTEQATDQGELVDRLAALDQLQTIVETINRFHSSEQRLDVLLRSFLQAIPSAQRGTVFLSTASEHIFVVGAVTPGNSPAVGTEIDTRGSYVSAVSQLKCPVLLPEAHHNRDESSKDPELHAQSALAIPFVIGGRTVGILALESLDQTQAFTQEDLKLATFLGMHLAMTINSARLRQMLPATGDWHAPELNTLQSLAKSVPVGVLIVDQTHFRVWSNSAFYEMTGFERGSLEGNLQRINPFLAQDSDSLNHMVGSKPIDLALSRQDKTTCPVKSVLLSFETLGIDHSKGYIGVFEDLSERNALEAKLFHMQRLSSVNTLMSGIAHELNNPLTAVICFAEWLLARDDMPPGCSKDLETIAKQAERGMNIVHELLDYVRLEVQHPTCIDLNYAIRQLVRFRKYTMSSAGGEIKLDLSETVPQVLGDVNQLQQLLLNLINNAEQACKAIEQPCTISINTRIIDDGHRVRLSIGDNGPGIPVEAQPHVFEPFFTTQPGNESTGLGLTICEQIVKRHKGTISFSSVAGEGTLFHIDLPLENASERQQDTPLPSHPQSHQPAARILVVDDEKSITCLLAKVMTRSGHHVDIAHDGQRAIERLQETNYDIVFLDLKIPGLSGRAIYEWIQQHQSHLIQRTVILTGDTMNSDTIDFLQQEDVPHLLKPFQLEELRDTLDRVWHG